ncbi:Bug family tripartite tricarboxylate transporter substrate binding protein [Klebsiella oxytoca]|uniref:Bug family tripartite tricarboxylate transporter substrate binding protein n=1 Tax=Klebsiella oxytoca TaxID=571 RepID=UPI00292EF737|nr:tripartite tricarboxylate transporter substrate binding protein [Klebsiella oxytoca]
MNIPFLRPLSAIALCLFTASAWAAEAPSRTECIAPAKPGGGFDLTCKLIQVSLMETGAIQKPMRVTYMPGGVGAVAYNAIVAQRPGEPGTDYGMIAVRADSPWKDLPSFMAAMEKNPASIVIGAGASIGSQDWMKAALLAQKANVDPHKMRYVAFEGGGEPVTALLGNHVQAVSGDLSEMVPYLQSNKIRVLAVFANERLPGALADVPTAKEQGYDLVWPIIRGFFVGPKVSDADYQWWVAEFTRLQQTDAFKKQRELRGLFEFNLNGKELDAYVKKQVEEYRLQAKSFGLAK